MHSFLLYLNFKVSFQASHTYLCGSEIVGWLSQVCLIPSLAPEPGGFIMKEL